MSLVGGGGNQESCGSSSDVSVGDNSFGSSDSYENEEFEEGKENVELIESESFREEEYSVDELFRLYKSAYHYSIDNFYSAFQEIKESYNKMSKENNILKDDKQKLIKIYSSSKELIEELKKRDEYLTRQYTDLLDKYEEEQRNHTKTIEELQELKKGELFGSKSAEVVASLKIRVENGKVQNIEVVESVNCMENESLMKVNILEKTVEEKMKKEKKLIEEKERAEQEKEIEIHRIKNEKNQLVQEKDDIIEEERKKNCELKELIEQMEKELKDKKEESLIAKENQTKGFVAQSEKMETASSKESTLRNAKSVDITPFNVYKESKITQEEIKKGSKKTFHELVKMAKDIKTKGMSVLGDNNDFEKYCISEFKVNKPQPLKTYLYSKKTPFYISVNPIEGVESSLRELFLIETKRNKTTELVSLNRKSGNKKVIAKNVHPTDITGNDNFLFFVSNNKIHWYSYKKRSTTSIYCNDFKEFIRGTKDIYFVNKTNQLNVMKNEKIELIKQLEYEIGTTPLIVGSTIFSLKNKRIVGYDFELDQEKVDPGLNNISAFTICDNNIWLSMPLFNQIGIVSFDYKRVKTVPISYTPSMMKVYGDYVFVAGRTHYSIISADGAIIYNAEIKVKLIDSICLSKTSNKKDCRMIVLSHRELYDFGTKLERHEIVKSEEVGKCCVCGQSCMELGCIKCHRKYHIGCYNKTMKEIEPCCEMKP